MFENIQSTALVCVLTPLITSIITGFFRRQVGRSGAHTLTIVGLIISFVCALATASHILSGDGAPIMVDWYAWVPGSDLLKFNFTIGFLLDPLTVVMMVCVTFVSLLVHIYTIGYMAEDDGYQRFFSYISLFTFFMLMLVTAKNLLQLFFGWEGVGLASYLLIGFWYTKESAIQGSLKAFLVNRVGDFGFLLGIAILFAVTGSIEYQDLFAKAESLANMSFKVFGSDYHVITVACICLFVGAMGKSAQVPLHVWLPESMEGPTPISALIHAATMVTAGIFMVARMSPLFELSETALSIVMIIGATGALFTGLLAVVMLDIKKVVAYSTLSQLGYMMTALGVSAYSAGIFHLLTHAAFKALLFLGAGSVIMALHHEQDMRKMGGLWKYMPITYVTFVIGTLALVAIPPFSGFYSKDIIIEAVALSQLPGAGYATFCVEVGAFVTALYSFRALFMTFHGNFRSHHKFVYESPWVVTGPLLALAIPSIVLGALLIQPMLFAKPSLLGDAIYVATKHDGLAQLASHYHGALGMIIDALFAKTLWLTLLGVLVAWFAYIARPEVPDMIIKRFHWLYRVLQAKYGFDSFNDLVFIKGTRALGTSLYRLGDVRAIDGLLVNGSVLAIYWSALRARMLQTGYLFHYASVMIIGVLLFLSWLLLGRV